MMIISRLLRPFSSQVSALSRYLQPVQLRLQQSSQLPVLRLKSEQYLLRNWWSERPFELPLNSPMLVPVFSFLTGQYLQQQIGTSLPTQNCRRTSSTVRSGGTSSTGSTTSASTSTASGPRSPATGP